MKYFLIIMSSLLVCLMVSPCRADQKAEKVTNTLDGNSSNLNKFSFQSLQDMEGMKVESLFHALKNPNWKVRAYAASLLGNFNDPRVPEVLARSMKDPQEAVRLGAVTGLGRLQRADMVIPALTGRSWLVRRLARSIMEKARMSNKIQLDVHLAPGQFMAGLIYQQPSFSKAIAQFIKKWQAMASDSNYYFLLFVMVGITFSFFYFNIADGINESMKIILATIRPIGEILIVIFATLQFHMLLLLFLLGLLYKGAINAWSWWMSPGYTKYYFIIPIIIMILLVIRRSRYFQYRKVLIVVYGLVIIFMFEPLLFRFLFYITDVSSCTKYYLLVSFLVTIVLLLGRYSLPRGSLSTGRIRLTKIGIFLFVLIGSMLTLFVQPFVASINYLLELPGTTFPIVSILLGTLALYSWLFLFFTPTVAVVASPLTLLAGSWRQAKRAAAGAICPSCAVRRFDYEKKELPLAVRLSNRWLAREVPEKHKDFLDYFRCGRCKGRKKMTGVRTLVGVIGNGPDKPEQRGTEAVVSLWDNRNEKSRYADIDRLEIRESDGVRYDMAINSVILTLHDRSGKPSGYLRKIPVRIIGNLPIPVGSMNILEQQFGKITRE